MWGGLPHPPPPTGVVGLAPTGQDVPAQGFPVQGAVKEGRGVYCHGCFQFAITIPTAATHQLHASRMWYHAMVAVGNR